MSNYEYVFYDLENISKLLLNSKKALTRKDKLLRKALKWLEANSYSVDLSVIVDIEKELSSKRMEKLYKQIDESFDDNKES